MAERVHSPGGACTGDHWIPQETIISRKLAKTKQTRYRILNAILPLALLMHSGHHPPAAAGARRELAAVLQSAAAPGLLAQARAAGTIPPCSLLSAVCPLLSAI